MNCAPFFLVGELIRLAGVGMVGYDQRRGLTEKPERAELSGHSNPVRRYEEQDVRRLHLED
jgi:hypothetical protein